jgi:hypothetical protein
MPIVGEKNPSRQVKRVQRPRSVEGPRQQGEIRLGEFLSPPEQTHDDKEISIGKKRSFDTATECDAVAIMATEKTCFMPPRGEVNSPLQLFSTPRLFTNCHL